MTEDRFGYAPEWRGLWVVRHDVIRDLAALNGFEMLSSDNWGLIETEEGDVTEADRELLDQAAALTMVEDDQFGKMNAFYEAQSTLRVPNEITCYNYIIDETNAVDVSALHKHSV